MDYKEDVKNLFSLSNSAKGWDERYNNVQTLFDHIMQNRRDYAVGCCLKYSDSSIKVIDVGCGAGPLIEKLQEHGYDPVGLDYSKDMLFLAKERCKGKNKNPRFLRGDCEELPFDDNQFDMVISLGVISYIKNDMKALAEIHRILRPNGIVILSVRNTLRPLFCDPAKLGRAIISKSLGRILRFRSSTITTQYDNDEFTIGRFYNPFRLRKKITEPGFSIKEIKGIGYGPFMLNDKELFSQKRSIIIDRFLDRLFNLTGTGNLFEWFADVSLFVLEKK